MADRVSLRMYASLTERDKRQKYDDGGNYRIAAEKLEPPRDKYLYWCGYQHREDAIWYSGRGYRVCRVLAVNEAAHQQLALFIDESKYVVNSIACPDGRILTQRGLLKRYRITYSPQ